MHPSLATLDAENAPALLTQESVDNPEEAGKSLQVALASVVSQLARRICVGGQVRTSRSIFDSHSHTRQT